MVHEYYGIVRYNSSKSKSTPHTLPYVQCISVPISLVLHMKSYLCTCTYEVQCEMSHQFWRINCGSCSLMCYECLLQFVRYCINPWERKVDVGRRETRRNSFSRSMPFMCVGPLSKYGLSAISETTEALNEKWFFIFLRKKFPREGCVTHNNPMSYKIWH